MTANTPAEVLRQAREALAYFQQYATGDRQGHMYEGDCPDPSQPDNRDPGCPACKAMDKAAAALAAIDALPSAPAWPCHCDERGIGKPGVTCGDCPRDYGHAVSSAPSGEPAATLYVEARECSDCGHVGINDDDGTAACNRCEWHGPSPTEDHCPGCDSNGTMTTACPECGHRTTLLASAHVPVPDRATTAPAPLPAFDIIAHLKRQAEFSAKTFGPGARVEGVTDHIAKELREVRESGGDLSEWVDVIILAFDGAWRSGASPAQIIDAMVAKQTKNEGRKWPDWRTAPAGKAIEHDRSGEADAAPLLSNGPEAGETGHVGSEWVDANVSGNPSLMQAMRNHAAPQAATASVAGLAGLIRQQQRDAAPQAAPVPAPSELEAARWEGIQSVQAQTAVIVRAALELLDAASDNFPPETLAAFRRVFGGASSTAAAAPEPVGVLKPDMYDGHVFEPTDPGYWPFNVPLYANPAPAVAATVRGLTDADIDAALDRAKVGELPEGWSNIERDIARAAIAEFCRVNSIATPAAPKGQQ